MHHRRQHAHEAGDRRRTRARARPAGKSESPFRGAVDEIEIELLVKRAGCDAPGIEVRIPASAALLSREGGGTSEPEPVFVTRRDAPIDRSALCSALAEAYFQPSFDSDADSVDTQMLRVPAADRLPRDRAPRVPRGRGRRGPARKLVTTCILPSMSGDSNVDIEIRSGALAAIHRI